MSEANTPSRDRCKVRVKAMRWEAEGVLRLTLTPLDGLLPEPTPGSHIDLFLPDGPVRQYSLTTGSSPSAYVLGVLREPRSRGGSIRVHETVRPGDVVEITPPRNTFALDDGDAPALLISGGIGITPILSMAEALSRTGRTWSMVACTRTRQALAFAEEVAALGIAIRADDEDGIPDMAALISGASQDTHLYCCGPGAMLDAFQLAAAEAGFPDRQVHVERFEPAKPKAGEGEIVVELARTGETVLVPSDETILDAILQAGIDVPCSCRVGVCGTCETQVLEGEPDHRDLILTDEERAEGKMMICCSRAKTQSLVLDI